MSACRDAVTAPKTYRHDVVSYLARPYERVGNKFILIAKVHCGKSI